MMCDFCSSRKEEHHNSPGLQPLMDSVGRAQLQAKLDDHHEQGVVFQRRALLLIQLSSLLPTDDR